jgi:hypothetical protein
MLYLMHFSDKIRNFPNIDTVSQLASLTNCQWTNLSLSSITIRTGAGGIVTTRQRVMRSASLT